MDILHVFNSQTNSTRYNLIRSVVHRNVTATALSGNVKKQHVAYPDQHFYEVLRNEYPASINKSCYCHILLSQQLPHFSTDKNSEHWIFKDFFYGNENQNDNSYVSFMVMKITMTIVMYVLCL